MDYKELDITEKMISTISKTPTLDVAKAVRNEDDER